MNPSQPERDAADTRPDSPVSDRPDDPGASDPLVRVLELVRFLRVRCPWDAAQTPRTLIPYLLEEAHEAAEAIAAEDDAELRDELGDLLLNVAFQIVLAEERSAFRARDVVDAVEAKMRRRHPHIYGGAGGSATDRPAGRRSAGSAASPGGETQGSGTAPAEPDRSGSSTESGGDPPSAELPEDHVAAWEALKSRERGDASVLSGIARGLDPLSKAHRIQDRVSAVGFDWAHVRGAFEKVAEELEEVRVALEAEPSPALEEELGDLLFAVVNLNRLAGAHALNALQRANLKFSRRFRALESLAEERGVVLGEASLEELDGLWEEVKGRESEERAT